MEKILNNPLVRYLREAREELRKVSWPTQKEVQAYTLLVIAITVAVAVYFGALDWALTLGVEALLK